MAIPTRRVAALVAIGVGALASCGDDSATTGGSVPNFSGTMPSGAPAVDLSPIVATAGRDVVMIGDSITLASSPGIEAAAAERSVEITILAEVGRRITVGNSPEAGVDVLADVLDLGQPDLFVIALGTNDIGKYASQDEYEVVIDEFLALVPDGAPVAWINAYLDEDPDDSAVFNAALIASLSARGNATIAKWSNIASEDGILSDGIHPTDDGEVHFADLVTTEIDNWLR